MDFAARRLPEPYAETAMRQTGSKGVKAFPRSFFRVARCFGSFRRSQIALSEALTKALYNHKNIPSK
jgi:hypothetical protein